MWQCNRGRLDGWRDLKVLLREHWEPWPLSTTLHHTGLQTGLSIFMAFSIQMCDLQVLLTSIGTCFLCVCMLCRTTVPMLHITCWAAWERGALWMTSSCSDRPHYGGVGTSKIPLIIREEDMLSLLFIYRLFSWPCFFSRLVFIIIII